MAAPPGEVTVAVTQPIGNGRRPSPVLDRLHWTLYSAHTLSPPVPPPPWPRWWEMIYRPRTRGENSQERHMFNVVRCGTWSCACTGVSAWTIVDDELYRHRVVADRSALVSRPIGL